MSRLAALTAAAVRASPRRLWFLPLTWLPLTTCTQLVAPDVGGAIAYVHVTGPAPYTFGTLKVVVRPRPGTHVQTQEFTWDSVQVHSLPPAWSADGRNLMFAANGPAGDEIFTLSYPAGQLTQVTNSPMQKLCPSWSPDGTRAAVARNGELVLVDLATKAETRVFATHPGVYVECPRWSPDGTKIAFDAEGGPAGQGEVYVVGVDGMGFMNLTNTPDDAEGRPSWSPDGRQIAFHSYGSGSAPTRVGGTHIMNADGSGASLLIERGDCPSWSPDGVAIAFSSGLHSTTVFSLEVYAIDLRDHDFERVSFEGAGHIFCPTWQP